MARPESSRGRAVLRRRHARRRLFDYNGTDTTPDVFSSLFSGTSTANNRGDRGWELEVQTQNNMIVVGGFHTRGLSPGEPVFAAIRLCEDPGDDACENPGNGPTDGGGGGRNGSYGFVPADAARLEPSAPVFVTQDSRSPTNVTELHDSPAPPELDSTGEPGAMQQSYPVSGISADQLVTDNLFSPLGEGLPLGEPFTMNVA